MQQRAAAPLGSPPAPREGMRILVGFLIVAAVIGGFVAHKQRQEATAPAQTVNAPGAPRDPSKYNFPKRTLNRVDDVKRQVAEERKSNEIP